jgi:hypothetical protein
LHQAQEAPKATHQTAEAEQGLWTRPARSFLGKPCNTLVQCYQFHTTSFVATVDNGKAVGGAAEDA